jgi:hypothetical protein
VNLKDLENEFQHLLGCCLHDPVWTPADATAVLCSIWNGGWEAGYPGWDDTPKNATESSSYTIARLKDGRLGLLTESEDYTGHGCQCGSGTFIYTDVADLLKNGIEDEQARAVIAERLA